MIIMSQNANITRPREIQSQGSQPLNFAEVFCDYRDPIYNYLLRMTQNQVEAEDLTQETFVRVHRSLPTFRGEASLSTWLYRIATNASLDHFRRRTTRQEKTALPIEKIELLDGDWDSDAPASPEHLAARSEMSACVQAFVQRLPPDQRAVLVLKELQGLKNREIAEVLECSLATVKSRLHRAGTKLREALGAGCDFSYDERNVLVCEPTEGGDQ